jgi:GntR family transcriptional regulator, transcriptional repressor for pyruvate dehydrogenase complex
VWQSVALAGTVSDRIAQQILKLIAAEEIRPGDRLPSERELATLLGVSRPSVREAVKALEAQGRLHVRHGQGVFVAAPSATKDLRAALARQEMTLGELFLMREVLEVPAADWAAAAGDQEKIAAATAALAELDFASTVEPPDYPLLQRLDSAFHMRIVEAAGNRFLRQTLGVLQEMLATSMETTLVVPGRLARSRTEHDRILDAVKRGDSAAARNAARRHIRSAQAAARVRLQDERMQAEQAGEPLASGPGAAG